MPLGELATTVTPARDIHTTSLVLVPTRQSHTEPSSPQDRTLDEREPHESFLVIRITVTTQLTTCWPHHQQDAGDAATVPRAPGGGERGLPWGRFVQASLLPRHSLLGPGTEEASCHGDLGVTGFLGGQQSRTAPRGQAGPEDLDPGSWGRCAPLSVVPIFLSLAI